MPKAKETNAMQAALKEANLEAIDMTWLGELLDTYGHQVLDHVVEALKEGWNQQLIEDLLKLGGDIALQFLLEFVRSMKLQAEWHEGEKVESLPQMLKPFIHLLINRYGDEILSWVKKLFS